MLNNSAGTLPAELPPQEHVSMATLIRQEKVREECISFTARMDRQHRPIYTLDTVHMPTFRKHLHHRAGNHRHRHLDVSGVDGNNKGSGGLSGTGGSVNSSRASGNRSLVSPPVQETAGLPSRPQTRGITAQTEEGHVSVAKAHADGEGALQDTSPVPEPKSLQAMILEVKQTPWRKPLKRKVMKPELDDYLDKMTPTQHAQFQDKVDKEMNRITAALHAKYERMRRQLDRKAVFHPDANAQRVHTMYMVHLTKSLNPEEIEDVVLEEMRSSGSRDKEHRQKEALAELMEGLFHASKSYARVKIPFPGASKSAPVTRSSSRKRLDVSGASPKTGRAQSSSAAKRGNNYPEQSSPPQQQHRDKPNKRVSSARPDTSASRRQQQLQPRAKTAGTAVRRIVKKNQDLLQQHQAEKKVAKAAGGLPPIVQVSKQSPAQTAGSPAGTARAPADPTPQPQGSSAGSLSGPAPASSDTPEAGAPGTLGDNERVGDQEVVDRQIADELGETIKADIMRRGRSGERLCERVNDLESVDVSKPGVHYQAKDPAISLREWEDKINGLVQRMQSELQEQVRQVVDEQEFRDVLATESVHVEGPDAIPVAQQKRKAVRRLAQEDSAFRDFAKLRRQQSEPRQIHTADPALVPFRPAGDGGLYDHRPQPPGSAPAQQQMHQQQQEHGRQASPPHHHHQKLVGSHFHDMAYGCSRVRTALSKPSAGFVNEFTGLGGAVRGAGGASAAGHQQVTSSESAKSSSRPLAGAAAGGGVGEDGGNIARASSMSLSSESQGEGQKQRAQAGMSTLSSEDSNACSLGMKSGSVDHSEDGALAMQSRMEKVMTDLKMPTAQRLSFLQKYCDMLSATQLPLALAAWERCTRLIVLRETLLAMHRDEIRIPDTCHPQVSFLDKVHAILPCATKRELLETSPYWLNPDSFYVTYQQQLQQSALSPSYVRGSQVVSPTAGGAMWADDGQALPAAGSGFLSSPPAFRTPRQQSQPSLQHPLAGDGEDAEGGEALPAPAAIPAGAAAAAVKKAVLAWLEAMTRELMLDLTQALIHLQNEFHDDITYKGKSYMKVARR